jgi:hypothetical protein
MNLAVVNRILPPHARSRQRCCTGVRRPRTIGRDLQFTPSRLPSILCDRVDALAYRLLAVKTTWKIWYKISPNLAKSPPSPHTPFSVVVLLVRTATLTGAEPRVLDVVADGVYYYNLSALFCLRRICRRGYELESSAVALCTKREVWLMYTRPCRGMAHCKSALLHLLHISHDIYILSLPFYYQRIE